VDSTSTHLATQRAAVLAALEQGPGTSRDIAAVTGLSVKHCSSYLTDLWRAGMVQRQPFEEPPARGRSSFLYQIAAGAPEPISPPSLVRLACAACGSGWMIRFGHDRKGQQRLRCRRCGSTVTLCSLRGGNRLSPEKEDALADALGRGLTIRSAARAAGVAKATAFRYAEVLNRPAHCPCGGPVTHQGWCWWRIQQSPARQAYLRRVTKADRQPLTADEALALQFLDLGTDPADIAQFLTLTLDQIQALAAIPAVDRPRLLSEALACEPNK